MAMKRFDDEFDECEYCGQKLPCSRKQCILAAMEEPDLMAHQSASAPVVKEARQ